MSAPTLYSASAYSAFVKNRFPQRTIDSLVTFGKPFLEAVKKIDDLEGAATYVPVETDHPQGYGAALSNLVTSSANRITSSRGVRWAITRVKGYGMLAIDGETMLAMRSNDGAWFRTRERETKNMLEQLGQQLEMFLWQSGNASLGTISNDPAGSTATATMTYVDNALNIHEGMLVQFYANSSGNPGSVRSNGPYTVSSVNYDTGVITMSANIDSSVASGDHMVRVTNADYITSQVGVCGVPRWIPSSDPTDTLFGVARTNYPQKLGGFRQSWLGSIIETVQRLDAKIRRVNQKPKTLWLSYDNFQRLSDELGSKAIRFDDGKEAVFNRPSLGMSSPGGVVRVMAGPYVPADAGYLLDMDTWELHHLGGLPHIVEDDGNTALRVQSMYDNDLSAVSIQDAIEIRFRWMCNLFCTNPFANGRAAISS